MPQKKNREAPADKLKPPRMIPPPVARFIYPTVRRTKPAGPDLDEDIFVASDDEC